MKTVNISLAVVAMCLLNSGCSSVGNVLIPTHPRSALQGDKYVLTVGITPSPLTKAADGAPTSAVAVAKGGPGAALAVAAVDFVLDEVQKGIEKEAKRYSATYSARTKTQLSLSAAVTPTSTKFEVIGSPKWLLEAKRGDALALSADIHWNQDGSAFYIVPTKFSFSGAGSKIASAGLPYSLIMPWRWPAMLSVGVLKIFGQDKYFKPDVNIQLQVEALTAGKSSTLGVVDFPMGKVSLGTDYILTTNNVKTSGDLRLASLESPWLPMPALQAKQGGDIIVPLNITLTVMEANDLGDVIAKGAEKAKEKKEDAAKSILEKLGIKNE